MDSVIRLRPGQNQSVVFQHQLLDTANEYKLDPEEMAEADRDAQVLANMWLVRRVVGRYLFHWPITEHMTDDMVSAGLEGVMECIDLLDYKAVQNAIKNRIEHMLNDSRSLVRASLRTNRRRSEGKEALEYGVMENLHPNVGVEDSDLGISEHLDQLSEDDLSFYQGQMTEAQLSRYLKRRDND